VQIIPTCTYSVSLSQDSDGIHITVFAYGEQPSWHGRYAKPALLQVDWFMVTQAPYLHSPVAAAKADHYCMLLSLRWSFLANSYDLHTFKRTLDTYVEEGALYRSYTAVSRILVFSILQPHTRSQIEQSDSEL
jgi:hypothetical protein